MGAKLTPHKRAYRGDWLAAHQLPLAFRAAHFVEGAWDVFAAARVFQLGAAQVAGIRRTEPCKGWFKRNNHRLAGMLG